MSQELIPKLFHFDCKTSMKDSIILYKDLFLNISLDNITHKLMDMIKPISKRYNTLEWKIMIYYDCQETINKKFINKLMNKLIYCKKLYIEIGFIADITLPPNLEELTIPNSYILSEYPKTLKVYKSYTYGGNCDEFILIPTNLPETVNKICLSCKNINKTFYNISQNVTILCLSINALDNIIWPMHLKKLKLHVYGKCNNSYGILPYGLEEFTFSIYNAYNHSKGKYNEYDYPLMLPPTLNKFKFECSLYNLPLSLPLSVKHFSFKCHSVYKYIESIDLLPDSIEHLELLYIGCPNLSRLPKECKTFKYIGCPNNIYDDFQEKYINVEMFYKLNANYEEDNNEDDDYDDDF